MSLPFYSRHANKLVSLAFFFCAALAAVYVVKLAVLPRIPPEPAPTATRYEWALVAIPTEADWQAMQKTKGLATASSGPLARVLRLAGTFFATGEEGTTPLREVCKAIIDDLQQKEQYLVKEGDIFNQVEVLRIYPDHVVLRNQGREEELWLSFLGNAGQPKPGTSGPVRPLAVQEETALETSRFGKRVGDIRWVLSRQALLDYYSELMDNPDRLASLFVSLKPAYKENGIAGYQLDMAGEKEFFQAMGLSNGDVVRKVNSMKMTSQARAEYFIGEFLKNRLSAIVLDIERNGQPQKLIYMVR